MDDRNPPVDSEKGITMLMAWARAGGWVLDEYHEKIAKRYKVSTEGVNFRRLMPLPGPTPNVRRR
jgi:hypothetical protein